MWQGFGAGQLRRQVVAVAVQIAVDDGTLRGRYQAHDQVLREVALGRGRGAVLASGLVLAAGECRCGKKDQCDGGTGDQEAHEFNTF